MKTLRQITRLILCSRPKRNENPPHSPLDVRTERKRKSPLRISLSSLLSSRSGDRRQPSDICRSIMWRQQLACSHVTSLDRLRASYDEEDHMFACSELSLSLVLSKTLAVLTYLLLFLYKKQQNKERTKFRQRGLFLKHMIKNASRSLI